MTLNGWIQILVFCGIVILLVKPLGGYMTRVFNGERTLLSPLLGPSSGGSIASPAPASTRSSTGRPMPPRMLLFNLAGFAGALSPAAVSGRRCPSIRPA